MGGGFGKYAKHKARVLKKRPSAKAGTEKREKDMFKNYARSAPTHLLLPV
jgi:hypothetical protein